MVIERLESYLKEQKIPFSSETHPLAFTAQEVAQAGHVSGRKLAKTVIVLADGAFAMAVLPADSAIELTDLRHAMGVRHLRLATEAELLDLFPDCELGAMPPFGNLYGLPVYVENSLAWQDMIAFNGGTHRDIVYMNFADFLRVVDPAVLSFARRIAA